MSKGNIEKKKIDIYPHNVEALLHVDENTTRFVNNLIEKYFNNQIVFLNEKNREVLLEICAGKEYSITDIVNEVIESVDIVTPDQVQKVRVVLARKKITAKLRLNNNYVTDS